MMEKRPLAMMLAYTMANGPMLVSKKPYESRLLGGKDGRI
jgi:hypothetical protein